MQTKLNIKKGDKVIVITGKNKGQQGDVVRSLPSENKVVVYGVNVVRRHTKPSQANPDGGIVTKELPIHASNVMHIDPKSGKPTKIGYKVKDGKKLRFAKKSGELIDRA